MVDYSRRSVLLGVLIFYYFQSECASASVEVSSLEFGAIDFQSEEDFGEPLLFHEGSLFYEDDQVLKEEDYILVVDLPLEPQRPMYAPCTFVFVSVAILLFAFILRQAIKLLRNHTPLQDTEQKERYITQAGKNLAAEEAC